MKTINLPTPPDPNALRYKTNLLAWQRDATDWMQKVKGIVETSHNEAVKPCGQQIQVGAFTTNTIIAGTTTGTDLANVLATLVATLTAKGILSPTVGRGQ